MTTFNTEIYNSFASSAGHNVDVRSDADSIALIDLDTGRDVLRCHHAGGDVKLIAELEKCLESDVALCHIGSSYILLKREGDVWQQMMYVKEELSKSA